MTDPPAEVLSWDSSFFGRKVARAGFSRMTRAEAAHLLSWCHENEVVWIHLLCGLEDPISFRTLSEAGFDLVDIRMELEACISSQNLMAGCLPGNTSLRDAVPGDLPALLAMATEAHNDSRFFSDRSLPDAEARGLFSVWMEESVLGDLADFVIVVERNGTVCGYVTGKKESAGRGRIGLLGVGAGSRGQGIGVGLVTAMLRRFQDHKILWVDVVTQGKNIGAQRTYQRCGFLTRSVKIWFHKWLQ